MKQGGFLPLHEPHVRTGDTRKPSGGRAPTCAPLLVLPVGFTGYIGAGTGSLIIQVVIASLVGGAFVLKLYWRRLVGLFKRGGASEEVRQ